MQCCIVRIVVSSIFRPCIMASHVAHLANMQDTRAKAKKKTIGARLCRARSDRGWSQAFIGGFVGVDGATISRWEAGESTPKADDAARLAEALGVTLGWLVEGRAPKARAK